jgi:hypothetical protein
MLLDWRSNIGLFLRLVWILGRELVRRTFGHPEGTYYSWVLDD